MDARNRIREKRLQQRMSRKQLAEISGLSLSTVANLERGTICLKARTICSLAKALECSADDLLGNEKS